MKFLIQDNLFKEEHYNTLIEIMEKHGFDYKIINVNKTIEDIEDLGTTNIFCFGSVRMARLAREKNWFPGSFMNDNHDYEVYSKMFGTENMLNGDSKIQKFSEPICFENNDKLFIRPSKDSKAFTGKCFNKYDWEEFVESHFYNKKESSILDENTIIQIAKPKLIQQEIRFWIVKGKIITSSYYKLGSIVYYAECFDEEIHTFVQKMVDIYQPAEAFVIDVCLVESTLKIVEINCINCSGFYKLDMSKLINSLLIFEN